MMELNPEDFSTACLELHEWISKHQPLVTNKGIAYALLRTGMFFTGLQFRGYEKSEEFVLETFLKGIQDYDEMFGGHDDTNL